MSNSNPNRKLTPTKEKPHHAPKAVTKLVLRDAPSHSNNLAAATVSTSKPKRNEKGSKNAHEKLPTASESPVVSLPDSESLKVLESPATGRKKRELNKANSISLVTKPDLLEIRPAKRLIYDSDESAYSSPDAGARAPDSPEYIEECPDMGTAQTFKKSTKKIKLTLIDDSESSIEAFQTLPDPRPSAPSKRMSNPSVSKSPKSQKIDFPACSSNEQMEIKPKKHLEEKHREKQELKPTEKATNLTLKATARTSMLEEQELRKILLKRKQAEAKMREAIELSDDSHKSVYELWKIEAGYLLYYSSDGSLFASHITMSKVKELLKTRIIEKVANLGIAISDAELRTQFEKKKFRQVFSNIRSPFRTTAVASLLAIKEFRKIFENSDLELSEQSKNTLNQAISESEDEPEAFDHIPIQTNVKPRFVSQKTPLSNIKSKNNTKMEQFNSLRQFLLEDMSSDGIPGWKRFCHKLTKLEDLDYEVASNELGKTTSVEELVLGLCQGKLMETVFDAVMFGAWNRPGFTHQVRTVTPECIATIYTVVYSILAGQTFGDNLRPLYEEAREVLKQAEKEKKSAWLEIESC